MFNILGPGSVSKTKDAARITESISLPRRACDRLSGDDALHDGSAAAESAADQRQKSLNRSGANSV
jgi:hypothetical protein